MLFLFLTEFIVKVFIKFLLRFFLLNKVLNLRIAITLQLGNEPLLIGLLLGLVLLLKLLIGLIRCLFLLVKILLCLLQVLASIIQLLYLDIEERVLHMHNLNLFHELSSLPNKLLQLRHGHVILVRLIAHIL